MGWRRAAPVADDFFRQPAHKVRPSKNPKPILYNDLIMTKSILLAILLCSGSLHAEGSADGAPDFMKIIQRENSLYLGLQGIASVAGQPDTIIYPLVINIRW